MDRYFLASGGGLKSDPEGNIVLYADVLTQPRMSAEVFRALTLTLDYGTYMLRENILRPWLDDEAKRHGYTDLRDAYEKLGREG